MRKKAAVALLVAMCSMTACGNRKMGDWNYTYNKAIIEIKDGELMEVVIKNWCELDSGFIQITTQDGKIYLTHATKCILVKE